MNRIDPELEVWITEMKARHQNKQVGKPCELSDAMEYGLFRLGIIKSFSKEVQAKVVDGSIHQERINLFTEHRSFTAQEKWQFMFEELAAFKGNQGNFVVSKSNNSKLYRWICEQRLKCRESKLAPEQLDLLNSIGFTWEGRGRCWKGQSRDAYM